MALNLKTFFTRSMSAVVFVMVLLGSLFFSYSTFSLFFLIVAVLGANEFVRLAEQLGARPYKRGVYLLAVLLYLSSVNWWYIVGESIAQSSPFYPFTNLLLILVPFFFLGSALFDKTPNPIPNALYSMAALVYAVLPMCLLHELVFAPSESGSISAAFEPWVLFGIILLIWSNDTFAYLGGSFFGKRKLIERISPGKTIEGTAIGIMITFGISSLFPALLPNTPPIHWMILGILVPVLATLGDLMESMLKRNAGLKDSGNILPGHGGVLDRFDSLILVSPVIVVLLRLLQL